MSLSLEQVWMYLQRIRFPLQNCLPRPDYSTLVQVHELHTRYVVFENMSIQVPSWRAIDMNNEGLKLDIPSLYDKIVKRGRGGYCFELNTLFAALLIGMGYNVRCGAARVVMGGLEVNPQMMQDQSYLMTPFVHQILFVSGGMLGEGQQYLCDVGYGDNTMTTPQLITTRDDLMPMKWNPPPRTDIPQYRLRWGKLGGPAVPEPQDADQGYYLQVWANRPKSGGAWHDMYYFTLQTYGPMDFVMANFFTSTFPSSMFVKGPFCSRVDEKGSRFTLYGYRLKCRDISGNKESQTLNTPEELAAVLLTYFGIQVPSILEVPLPR